MFSSTRLQLVHGTILYLICTDYVDYNGVSQENAVWVNGKIHLLGKVDIEMPEDRETGLWKVRSTDESCQNEGQPTRVCVNLVFTPRGARGANMDVIVLKSDFVQPYGTFEGDLRLPSGEVLSIENTFGVVEDHIAIW
jgi:hypothetical protein